MFFNHSFALVLTVQIHLIIVNLHRGSTGEWHHWFLLTKFCGLFEHSSTCKSRRLFRRLPKVLAVVKVPGRSVADHLSALRFHQHRLIPELLRHFNQSQRGEELFCHLEHLCGIIALVRKHNNVSLSTRLFCAFIDYSRGLISQKPNDMHRDWSLRSRP